MTIRGGIIMQYRYEYELKKLVNKNNVNLKSFENEIKGTLNEIFADKFTDAEVFEKYFQFTLTEKANDIDRRQLGKSIASKCQELNSIKERYGYSTQLFVGKEYIFDEISVEEIISLDIKDVVYDSCSKCFSVLSTINVGDYEKLISKTYMEKGGIEGQREKLKTTTAIRIFNRMIDDVKKGAILPSIVVGVFVPKDSFNELIENEGNKNYENIKTIIKSIDKDNLSIIDGMQRTAILLDNKNIIEKNIIRVEFWIASNHNSLTYRMLVLNTGQIPWSLRRQVEVVFSPMIKSIKEIVNGEFENVEIFKIDDKRKRVDSGQYQADKILEMYLAFNLRKESTDLPEQLASEFSKLDMLESVAKENTYDYFIELFKAFIRLDIELGKLKRLSLIHSEGKFIDGKDLFTSQPACIGFFAAASRKIFGRLGSKRDTEQEERYFKFVIDRCWKVIKILNGDIEKVKKIVSFDVLMEELPNTKSNIGEKERKYFREAFEVLFEDNFELESLQSCWRR